MQIVKHYRENDGLRASFNALAQKTFGISFEDWYQRGFWRDRYDPYSVVENGRVIANVSVNRMILRIGGEEKHLIQLGTVMTEESCRNRGLIRLLMEQIRQEFADADGMFLFANDSVLDFYPKFGFRRAVEHCYEKNISATGECRMERVPMDMPEQWQRLEKAMQTSRFCSGCDMLDNPGLMFFYIFAELSDCVFYCRELDVWTIARQDGEALEILAVFADGDAEIDQVAAAFGGGFTRLVLGFAPKDPARWERKILQEEGSTFFVKGALFDRFQENGLRIPVLGRA